jgi:HK97 family phage prohead protease
MPTPTRLIERRSYAPASLAAIGVAAVRAAGDGHARTITGYAAVFYDGTARTEYLLYDDLVERIMPTAFDRAVKECDVRALFNHNPDHLLGRSTAGTLRLAVDRVGLAYEISCENPPCVTQDVLASIARGDLTGSSFSFSTRPNGKVVWVEEGDRLIREIHAVDTLYDVGPVTYPAYEATTAGVRSAWDSDDETRERYAAWRTRRSKPWIRYQHLARARAIATISRT